VKSMLNPLLRYAGGQRQKICRLSSVVRRLSPFSYPAAWR
jgi:hypothetical protein